MQDVLTYFSQPTMHWDLYEQGYELKPGRPRYSKMDFIFTNKRKEYVLIVQMDSDPRDALLYAALLRMISEFEPYPKIVAALWVSNSNKVQILKVVHTKEDAKRILKKSKRFSKLITYTAFLQHFRSLM